MNQGKPRIESFRRKLRNGDLLFGTFIKIPTTHTTEIIGGLGFDFIVIDQEHSPFDRITIDALALASQAFDLPALVRVAEPTDAAILSVLDCGATGVLVPHIDSEAKARRVAAACRYRNGSRGFATTTRAGGFGGATMAQHVETQDTMVTCVAMIEDAVALDDIDAIAAVEGIDAFFIGRSDLTVSLGAASANSPETEEAVERIMAAAGRVGMPVVVLPSSKAAAQAMKTRGATAFILSSDQGFLKQGAQQVLEAYAVPAGE